MSAYCHSSIESTESWGKEAIAWHTPHARERQLRPTQRRSVTADVGAWSVPSEGFLSDDDRDIMLDGVLTVL